MAFSGIWEVLTKFWSLSKANACPYADKHRQVWSPHFGHCQKSLRAHDDAVTGLAFLPGTHVAVSCGKDKAVKLWDLDRYEQARTRAKPN